MATAKLKEIGLPVQSRNNFGWIERSLTRCPKWPPKPSGRNKAPRPPRRAGCGARDPPLGSDAFQRAAIALHCLHVPDSS